MPDTREPVRARVRWLVPLAAGTVVFIVVVVLLGIRHSAQLNMVVVGITLLTLVMYVVALIGEMHSGNFSPFIAGEAGDPFGFFEGTALSLSPTPDMGASPR